MTGLLVACGGMASLWLIFGLGLFVDGLDGLCVCVRGVGVGGV